MKTVTLNTLALQQFSQSMEVFMPQYRAAFLRECKDGSSFVVRRVSESYAYAIPADEWCMAMMRAQNTARWVSTGNLGFSRN